jgi:hypothetical protein
MGKKTRLDEATVRRFMKLAELHPVSTGRFFNEQDDEVPEEEEVAVDEVPGEEEVVVDEVPEEGGEGEAGEAEVEMAERVANAVMVALEDELGVSTDVAVPEEGGEEVAVDEVPPEVGDEEVPLAEAHDDDEKKEKSIEERVVNEVTRRVAQRLLNLKKTRRRKQ